MEVFQILVVVAMIGIAVWQKRREKQAKSIRKPERKRQEGPDVSPAAVPPPVSLGMKASKQKKEARKPAVQMPPSSPTPAACKKQDSSISLRTAEEVRRAFIYSEILKRKYE